MKRTLFTGAVMAMAIILIIGIDLSLFYHELAEDVIVGSIIGGTAGYITRPHRKLPKRIRK